MKKLFSIYLLFICLSGFSQKAAFKVYLIGDAGDDTAPGEALLLLKEELLSNPNSAVIFLGDNVYPNGLRKDSKESVLHLESQLQILKEYKGRVFFIPGNHDWDAQKRNGLRTLKDQEDYVGAYLRKNSTVSNKEEKTFLPSNGLPGPETLMLDEKLRLIVMDSQWFLHFYKKNKVGTKRKTKVLFYKRLDSLLAYSSLNNEQVIIAAHHPMYSNGTHSKFRQPFRFLVNCTPFQILGLCGLNRLFSQDLPAPHYRKMRRNMLASMSSYSNIVFASGHEHNLQCFKESGNRYIVSGSGSKLSHFKRKNRFKAVFQDDQKTGFMRVEYFDGKYAGTTVFRVGQAALMLEGY